MKISFEWPFRVHVFIKDKLVVFYKSMFSFKFRLDRYTLIGNKVGNYITYSSDKEEYAFYLISTKGKHFSLKDVAKHSKK